MIKLTSSLPNQRLPQVSPGALGILDVDLVSKLGQVDQSEMCVDVSLQSAHIIDAQINTHSRLPDHKRGQTVASSNS